jgi:hypothetical protein
LQLIEDAELHDASPDGSLSVAGIVVAASAVSIGGQFRMTGDAPTPAKRRMVLHRARGDQKFRKSRGGEPKIPLIQINATPTAPPKHVSR